MSYPLPEELVHLVTRPMRVEAGRALESLYKRFLAIESILELGVREMEVLIKRLPAEPPQRRIPADLEGFRPGDSIEVQVDAGHPESSRLAVTDPLVFVRSELEGTSRALCHCLGEISRSPSVRMSRFEHALVDALGAASKETRKALHRHLEKLEQEPWEPLGIVPFKEDAGLRESFAAHLPRRLSLSLQVLLAHLYDTSRVEPDEGQQLYEAEVKGLLRDLAYLANRLEFLATFEHHGSLSAREVHLLDLADELWRLLQPAVEKLRESAVLDVEEVA